MRKAKTSVKELKERIVDVAKAGGEEIADAADKVGEKFKSSGSGGKSQKVKPIGKNVKGTDKMDSEKVMDDVALIAADNDAVVDNEISVKSKKSKKAVTPENDENRNKGYEKQVPPSQNNILEKWVNSLRSSDDELANESKNNHGVKKIQQRRDNKGKDVTTNLLITPAERNALLASNTVFIKTMIALLLFNLLCLWYMISR